MTLSHSHRVASLVVTGLFVLAGLAPSAVRADEVPAAVNRTHAAIQQNADRLLKMAYPTALRTTAATDGNWAASLGGGYSLTERFRYLDSDGPAQLFTLRFNMNARGEVTSVAETQRSELWPTFGTGNLILGLLKEAAREEIAKARQAGREPPPVAALVLNAGTIEDVVVAVINAER